METVYDIHKILSLLPHRYPFILVDRVVELIPQEKIIAYKNVTINEPFFQGHFPSQPIMPGVLIVEAMAQAGGVLHLASLPPELHGAPLYFMGIDKVKFRWPVIPGDQLMLEVTTLRKRLKTIKLAGKAIVDGKKVAEAEFMATIGEKE
jgi:3-hydroxyacyl-[acyl-carrier-protein] dehydratase